MLKMDVENGCMSQYDYSYKQLCIMSEYIHEYMQLWINNVDSRALYVATRMSSFIYMTLSVAIMIVNHWWIPVAKYLHVIDTISAM